MVALILRPLHVAAILLAIAPAPATADVVMGQRLEVARSASVARVERWQLWMIEASNRFNVPVAWIAAVMRAESGGHTHRDGRRIVSRSGAIGLMQLMPATWQAMRRQHGLGIDPHDPHDNIMAGAGYLRAMYDRFGYPGLFGAYNAGPERYAAYLGRRKPLPAETWAYLANTTDGAHQMASRPIRSAVAVFVSTRLEQGAASVPVGSQPKGGAIFFTLGSNR